MFSCGLKIMEPGEGDRAIDVKKYRHESPAPSKEDLARLCAVIEGNLAEMKQISLEVGKIRPCLISIQTNTGFFISAAWHSTSTSMSRTACCILPGSTNGSLQAWTGMLACSS